MNTIVPVVEMKKEGLIVSSRIVAKQLGKQHKHVLESLDKIFKNSTADISALLIKNEYKAANGKKNKEYLLTKDGFTLYMFNIQGYVDFKMAYINEFNRMEQALKQPKQLQIEEPYQVIKKTLHGKPVMTIRDIVHLTGESKQVIYWNAVHRNVAYVLLEGKELEEFKKENNLKHFWNSLIVLPREGVSRLFTVLGKNQDQVEEYFGKEKPSIKAFQDVYTLQPLKGFNQVMFISKEFREKLDTIISEEYIRLGLLSAPCKDLATHTPIGWNLTNDIIRFYRKFI